ESENGAWNVGGVLRLLPPHLFRYRIVAKPDYDVVREAVPQSGDRSWRLIVPIQIPVHKAPEDPAAARKHETRRIDVMINGRLLMEQLGTPSPVEVTPRPLGLGMDRYGEVLAHFLSETRFPRTAPWLRGEELAAAGKRDEAETAFRSALSTP